jgi:hypothetical protein
MSNLHDQFSQYQQPIQNDEESEVDKFRRYFYNRAQEQTETVEEFFSELERLSRGARFDLQMPQNVVEKLLRDRSVSISIFKEVNLRVNIIIAKHRNFYDLTMK